MSLAARAWERKHGTVADPAVYEREILPKIRTMSVRRLAALIGLSDYYLWQVRKKEKRLHARFWSGSHPLERDEQEAPDRASKPMGGWKRRR